MVGALKLLLERVHYFPHCGEGPQFVLRVFPAFLDCRKPSRCIREKPSQHAALPGIVRPDEDVHLAQAGHVGNPLPRISLDDLLPRNPQMIEELAGHDVPRDSLLCLIRDRSLTVPEKNYRTAGLNSSRCGGNEIPEGHLDAGSDLGFGGSEQLSGYGPVDVGFAVATAHLRNSFHANWLLDHSPHNPQTQASWGRAEGMAQAGAARDAQT